jgi:site-specific DNA-methyltransferase (adenine-specific)
MPKSKPKKTTRYPKAPEEQINPLAGIVLREGPGGLPQGTGGEKDISYKEIRKSGRGGHELHEWGTNNNQDAEGKGTEGVSHKEIKKSGMKGEKGGFHKESRKAGTEGTDGQSTAETQRRGVEKTREGTEWEQGSSHKEIRKTGKEEEKAKTEGISYKEPRKAGTEGTDGQSTAETQGRGGETEGRKGVSYREPKKSGTEGAEQGRTPQRDIPTRLNLYYEAPPGGVWLYQNNCLEVMDAIAARHPEGRFDMIFADPPYFLSNGGITCHAGKMVSVHKGDWDQSRGPEWNHEFNIEWLKRCQRVLKPNGTIWVTGTHHVIFSVGYAMQQLGFKVLNDIAWEKPNPPPNLSCRYFTHSTETILWAAKNAKSKHVFNYQEMRRVTGKQMKTVWRKGEFEHQANEGNKEEGTASEAGSSRRDDLPRSAPVADGRTAQRAVPTNESDPALNPIWTMTAPGNGEKEFGKHPTQKPVALVERCLLAATNPGDLVLDPFLGGGTTAVACVRLRRGFVGVELDLAHLTLATKRADREIVLIWLRDFRVKMEVSVCCVVRPHPNPMASQARHKSGAHQRTCASRIVVPQEREGFRAGQMPPPSESISAQIDLDLISNLIDRSAPMADKPEMATERIFHETKFVFLSCATVTHASVVHTTVDISLQEAWTNAPTGKKRETTHIIRCETEILRLKSG